ncbi:MAG: hypothetical protein K2W91_00880 [Novosphingobium sp.]|nr:hypothetical protein [Novosphingobium sp.]
MAVLNHSHLLQQADHLLQPNGKTHLVRQVDRRRAISAAYYAVFHFVLSSFADEFVGARYRTDSRYALAYRSVDHNKLASLCKGISSQRGLEKFGTYFPKAGFGPNILEFASLLPELKELRNSADYDPSHWVTLASAKSAVKSASSAIKRFESASAARRKAFLTLLAFPPR